MSDGILNGSAHKLWKMIKIRMDLFLEVGIKLCCVVLHLVVMLEPQHDVFLLLERRQLHLLPLID